MGTGLLAILVGGGGGGGAAAPFFAGEWLGSAGHLAGPTIPELSGGLLAALLPKRGRPDRPVPLGRPTSIGLAAAFSRRRCGCGGHALGPRPVFRRGALVACERRYWATGSFVPRWAHAGPARDRIAANPFAARLAQAGPELVFRLMLFPPMERCKGAGQNAWKAGTPADGGVSGTYQAMECRKDLASPLLPPRAPNGFSHAHHQDRTNSSNLEAETVERVLGQAPLPKLPGFTPTVVHQQSSMA